VTEHVEQVKHWGEDFAGQTQETLRTLASVLYSLAALCFVGTLFAVIGALDRPDVSTLVAVAAFVSAGLVALFLAPLLRALAKALDLLAAMVPGSEGAAGTLHRSEHSGGQAGALTASRAVGAMLPVSSPFEQRSRCRAASGESHRERTRWR